MVKNSYFVGGKFLAIIKIHHTKSKSQLFLKSLKLAQTRFLLQNNLLIQRVDVCWEFTKSILKS